MLQPTNEHWLFSGRSGSGRKRNEHFAGLEDKGLHAPSEGKKPEAYSSSALFILYQQEMKTQKLHDKVNVSLFNLVWDSTEHSVKLSIKGSVVHSVQNSVSSSIWWSVWGTVHDSVGRRIENTVYRSTRKIKSSS